VVIYTRRIILLRIRFIILQLERRIQSFGVTDPAIKSQDDKKWYSSLFHQNAQLSIALCIEPQEGSNIEIIQSSLRLVSVI
jgi:hypothetical protein